MISEETHSYDISIHASKSRHDAQWHTSHQKVFYVIGLRTRTKAKRTKTRSPRSSRKGQAGKQARIVKAQTVTKALQGRHRSVMKTGPRRPKRPKLEKERKQNRLRRQTGRKQLQGCQRPQRPGPIRTSRTRKPRRCRKRINRDRQPRPSQRRTKNPTPDKPEKTFPRIKTLCSKARTGRWSSRRGTSWRRWTTCRIGRSSWRPRFSKRSSSKKRKKKKRLSRRSPRRPRKRRSPSTRRSPTRGRTPFRSRLSTLVRGHHEATYRRGRYQTRVRAWPSLCPAAAAWAAVTWPSWVRCPSSRQCRLRRQSSAITAAPTRDQCYKTFFAVSW